MTLYSKQYYQLNKIRIGQRQAEWRAKNKAKKVQYNHDNWINNTKPRLRRKPQKAPRCNEPENLIITLSS